MQSNFFVKLIVIAPHNIFSGTFAGDQYSDEEVVTRSQTRSPIRNNPQ